jgi:L-lactate dehydrogenase complex protein LldG
MSEGRDQILAGLRQALGRGPLDPARQAELDRRLEMPHPNLIPARARLDGAARVEMFCEMAEESAATVARVERAGDVPGAVAEYLAQQNLPPEAVLAPDPGLDDIPWEARPLLTLRRGGTDGSDVVSVTGAYAGVAETGTLVMTSAPGSPTLLNFLPETQIVVLRAGQVVGAYEEAIAQLRDAGGTAEDAGFMPRTVCCITGPSRSGDIEQTLQMGAHGPRRVHIIVVGDAS